MSWRLTGLFLAFACGAPAQATELRWTHPYPEEVAAVEVFASGAFLFSETPLQDGNGIFRTDIGDRPYAGVRLAVRYFDGRVSGRSLTWRETCSLQDLEPDGVVGGPDWTRFVMSYGTCAGNPGYLPAIDVAEECIGGPEFVNFSLWFGARCF